MVKKMFTLQVKETENSIQDMGIFGLYVLFCTFVLLAYYAVTIWFDLRGNKGRKKEDAEVISTDGIVDTETSTEVKELDGGGYQLNATDDDEDSYLDVEDPNVSFGDEQESGESVSEESSPSVGGGDVAEGQNDDNNDGDPDPSQFERALQLHDEELNPIERIYQEQLNCREMVAQLACPLSQKTRIYRQRSVY